MKSKEFYKLEHKISTDKSNCKIGIRKEMDDYKGKFFIVNELDDIVRISILKVNTEQRFSNVFGYVRCFFCKNKDGHSWWQLDEDMDLEHGAYDLEKLENTKEISENQYISLRNKIVKKIKEYRKEKLEEELNEIDATSYHGKVKA